MKDKIMVFIIGVLVGAVLSTGVFFAYTKISNNNNNNGNVPQMNGQEPPDKPDGDPPEKPSDDNN